MRAAVHRRYGPPSVLRVEEVPRPEPGPDEVLVEVMCSSVNRTDAGFLRAKPFVVRFFGGLRRPRHLALGCEFAGAVAAVGSDVSRFAVGDRVFGFDDSGWGGHAEYKVIAERKAVAAIPDGVSVEQAAAATEGAHYALVDLRAARVGRGTRLFVHGAVSAAVQLGRYLGAHVVATSTSRVIDVVSALGPDRVIDHERSDFTADDEQFDVVFDAVGKSSFAACRRLLVPGGVYMSTELGPKGQNPLLALAGPLGKLVGARRVLFPIPTCTQDDIEFLGHRLTDGDFAPVIDRTYPLDQIVEAFEYVETGQKLGNVVVQVAPES